MMNSTKQQKVVPMMPIKNIRSFLSLCDESFVDDMIGYMIMVEDMELKLPENINEVSLKEEANALVCYAIFKGLLQEFQKKNKLVDDNTIDNILDDSHYYIYNWLIMKFSVPTPLYAMIVHHTNAYLESNSWDKSNPFENFQYNYQMNSHKDEVNDEEFRNALNLVSKSLEKCSDELKEYIDQDLIDIMLGQEWFCLNKEALENNVLMLQEHAFIKSFDKMYEADPNFLYKEEGLNKLMLSVSNCVAEYLHFLNNLYENEEL